MASARGPRLRHRGATWGVSAGGRREGCPNSLRETGGAVGRLRALVDLRASPQFVKRQRRIDPTRKVEITIDQTVEQMADVKAADPAGGVRITHDVDGAAVSQQMIKLRPIGEFIDPRQVNKEQPSRIVG